MNRANGLRIMSRRMARTARTAWFVVEIILIGRRERRDPATAAWIVDNLEVVSGRAAGERAP